MAEDTYSHYFEHQGESTTIWWDGDCEEIVDNDDIRKVGGPVWVCGVCDHATYDEQEAVACCRQ